jgi:hypothetical protein
VAYYGSSYEEGMKYNEQDVRDMQAAMIDSVIDIMDYHAALRMSAVYRKLGIIDANYQTSIIFKLIKKSKS